MYLLCGFSFELITAGLLCRDIHESLYGRSRLIALKMKVAVLHKIMCDLKPAQIHAYSVLEAVENIPKCLLSL